MPLPEEGANKEERIGSFTEAELRNILKKASPRACRDTQEKSNIRFDSVSAQVQYYEKLRNIDERNANRSESKKITCIRTCVPYVHESSRLTRDLITHKNNI